jgi:hypothetical protein
VQFRINPLARQILANPSALAVFHFQSAWYNHQSPQLSEDVRQSLLDDLILSDRDAA